MTNITYQKYYTSVCIFRITCSALCMLHQNVPMLVDATDTQSNVWHTCFLSFTSTMPTSPGCNIIGILRFLRAIHFPRRWCCHLLVMEDMTFHINVKMNLWSQHGK